MKTFHKTNCYFFALSLPVPLPHAGEVASQVIVAEKSDVRVFVSTSETNDAFKP